MVSVSKGSFAKPTGGAPATQSINVGFQMTAGTSVLWLWCTKQTAEGSANQGFYAFGVSDGTTHSCIADASMDGVASSQAARNQRNVKILSILANGNDVTAPSDECTVSYTATGFDLTWNPNTANAYLIHYLAVAGLDNVEVGNFTMPIVTGNQTITLAGAFQPNFVMIFSARRLTSDNTLSSVPGAMNISAFTGSGKDFALSVASEDGRLTMDTWKWQRQNSVCTKLTPTTGAVDARAIFVSINSNGWTHDWTDASGAADIVYYVAIKGGQWAADEFTKTLTAATVTQDITTVGFQPKAYMLLSLLNAVNNGAIANSDSNICIGATDGTAEGSAAMTDEDDVADSDTYNNYNTTKAITMTNATNGSVNSEADHSAFLSNGFRLSWTTNDTNNAWYIFYIAVGDAVVGAGRNRGHVM